MTKKILIVFFFLTALYTQAQDRKEYDTDHYRERTAYFEQNPIGNNKIVFLGNSLTEGGQWEKYFPQAIPINRGISGDNTEGMLNRINEIAESHPTQLFILAGINDVSQNLPNKQIIKHYRYIIKQVKKESPQTVIYIQSLLPINNDFGRYKRLIGKEKQIIKLNKELKKLASKEKANFLNINPLYIDEKGKLDAQYTNDGLHLTETAYSIWVNELQKYIH